jgi:hypothetical protein
VHVAGIDVDHGAVEIQVLVAGHVRDVDAPPVVVIEDIALHGHRTEALRVIVVVQSLGQGGTTPVTLGMVVTTAVLDQLGEDNRA